MVANVFFYNASGTTSGGYHIEFVFDERKQAEDFADVLASYEMLPKLMEKNKFIVYLKSSQCLCNLLALIGAKNTLMELHNYVAMRDVRNNSNRRANCDTANISRQVEAAQQQVAKIQQLVDGEGFGDLDLKLQETALARLHHPEASYEELAKKLGITKSGLVNRLRKITG